MSGKERLIIKVGTNVITEAETKGLNLGVMYNIALQSMKLMDEGCEVILASSGALGRGIARLSLDYRPKRLEEKQACAAIGQSILMDAWQTVFGPGRIVSQVLPTNQELSTEISCRNFKNTVEQLLSWGSIPIINENDPMSIAEIDEKTFSDNDTLSALGAVILKANKLFIVTDVDGLYDRNPSDPEARLIEVVSEISCETIQIAQGASIGGRGGMTTKLESMKTITGQGIDGYILGPITDGIFRIMKGERVGTYFPGNKK